MTDSPFTHIDQARLRAGTGVKWAAQPPDTIGAWVADMDFGVSPAIRSCLLGYAEREDFGYPLWPWSGQDPLLDAFHARMADRHHWQPAPDRARVFTDLLQILQVVVEHTTKPGDGIALHVPNYPPFLASIERAGRRIVPIPMIHRDDGWGYEADGLADRLRAAGVRMLLLVNPHNPTGRVLRRDELATLAEVADELDLTVMSDEIHADLMYPGHRHIPFASLGEHTANRTVTATSATKAFNIAGLRCAVAHIGPPKLKAALDALPIDYFGTPSTVGIAATVAAWRDSDAWLAELLATLTANRATIATWLANHLPSSQFHLPEATYLAWFDLPGHPSPATHFADAARVLLSDGADFNTGPEIDTTSFVRLNFATSPDNLATILHRLAAALPDRQVPCGQNSPPVDNPQHAPDPR